MKTRIILLLCGLVLLNSCILKSIQPFYIAKAISYQQDFIGNWEDPENGSWNIASFKTVFESEKEDPKLTEDDKILLDKYKDAYVVSYTKKDNKATFIVIPFQVNGKLFVDFTPFNDGLENVNQLLAQHLIRTHSIAKVERLKNNGIRFKWLDESKIEALQKQQKIRLKSEKIDLEDDYILTATSAELYAFLEKFEASNGDEIWGSSDQITLQKVNAKP
ncbi:hypothetical protein [Kordia sp.]|uniref:hypothetical protein n=1 Tax=Kordia sp. TaxID=1965332 RepID=UPI003B591FEA